MILSNYCYFISHYINSKFYEKWSSQLVILGNFLRGLGLCQKLNPQVLTKNCTTPISSNRLNIDFKEHNLKALPNTQNIFVMVFLNFSCNTVVQEISTLKNIKWVGSKAIPKIPCPSLLLCFIEYPIQSIDLGIWIQLFVGWDFLVPQTGKIFTTS